MAVVWLWIDFKACFKVFRFCWTYSIQTIKLRPEQLWRLLLLVCMVEWASSCWPDSKIWSGKKCTHFCHLTLLPKCKVTKMLKLKLKYINYPKPEVLVSTFILWQITFYWHLGAFSYLITMLKYQYILVDKIDYPSVIFESDLGKINHQTFCLKFSIC